MDKREILEVLNRVYDPDYVDRSVLDMGLVTEDDITMLALTACSPGVGQPQQGSMIGPGMMSGMPMMQDMLGYPQTAEMVGTS